MKPVYRCPVCRANIDNSHDASLTCSNGHEFRYIANTRIPVFDQEAEAVNEYAGDQAAEMHDNALNWVFETYKMKEEELRSRLISKLNLQQGQSILITGVGAGNDLPYIASKVGVTGEIYAQDFAAQMLLSAASRVETVFGLKDFKITFSVSDATNLPFQDSSFDAVYHFGGLNLFSSIPKGISELDRVVKNGGRVVFGDEGLAPWIRDTERGRLIINNNQLCSFEAPLEHIPTTARNVNLSWDSSYCFYIIDYTSSNTDLPLDLDVVHKGKRGGTLRTRYYGQLEGVDPDLKETIYAEAERKGESRVDYLEKLLRTGLKSVKPK